MDIELQLEEQRQAPTQAQPAPKWFKATDTRTRSAGRIIPELVDLVVVTTNVERRGIMRGTAVSPPVLRM